MRTVGELIVDTLVQNGVDRAFCVPGESYLGLLDALYGRRDIKTIVCHHESGAGFMAIADARLTQRLSVAIVSRGPGACNAAIAVHTSQQDEVPFILIVGQVAVNDVRRDAFQEIDYGRMFGSIAKWTAEVTDPDRAAETLLRAIQTATSGIRGPVVLAFPEDVLTAPVAAEPVRPQSPVRGAPRAEEVDVLRRRLAESVRPLLIAGPELEHHEGRAALLAFMEAWELPAVVTFRRQDLLPNAHRLYAGDMGLSNPSSQMDLLRQADLVIVLGAQLGDITTQGYTFPTLVRPQMMLAHVHSDPSAIGTHYAADLAIVADPCELMGSMEGPPHAIPPRRANWIADLKAAQRAIAKPRHFGCDDGVPFEAVIEALSRCLPPDAIVTADAGSFAAPLYRIVPIAPPQRLLAPISGAMGFGVPAAVAAALREPKRPVICLVGDGGFLMTGNELAVALQHDANLKVILSENGIYGSIRIHQERNYPGRTVGTSFKNPDLELIGRAFGMPVARIRDVSDLDQLPGVLAPPGSAFILVQSSIAAILPRPQRLHAEAQRSA